MEKLLEKFGNKYSVSDNGIIYSLKGNKKELKGKIGNSGYREILINHNGIRNDIGSYRQLAIKYNIGRTQIGYIKLNKRWKKSM